MELCPLVQTSPGASQEVHGVSNKDVIASHHTPKLSTMSRYQIRIEGVQHKKGQETDRQSPGRSGKGKGKGSK